MKHWYVKELSKLTQISTQTLHHYDRIDLLKPSVRLDNGYRLYSETDLLKLQQIIALKFFGFELAQIKTMLDADVDVLAHFSSQAKVLEEKAKSLFTASETLKNITADCSRDKSIPWETIIKLIEVYRMTQQIQNSWAGKVFTPDELKELINFEQELKTRFTEKELKAHEKEWDDIIREVNASVSKDPASSVGIALGKRCMEWVNSYFGKKYAPLRNAMWEKGFTQGVVNEEGATPQTFAWLDKAVDAYYRGRIYGILNHTDTLPHEVATNQWEELLEDMYGDELAPKREIFKSAMTDERVNPTGRDWLKKYFKKYQ